MAKSKNIEAVELNTEVVSTEIVGTETTEATELATEETPQVIDYDPNYGKEIIDVDQLSAQRQQYREQLQVQVKQAASDVAHRRYVDKAWLFGLLAESGTTDEAFADLVKSEQRTMALVEEREQLREQAKGRGDAVRAKSDLEKRHREELERQAVELREAEHEVYRFDAMSDRLRRIDAELKNLAPQERHDELKTAELALQPLIVAVQQNTHTRDGYKYLVTELGKHLADEWHKLPHNFYPRRITREHAQADFDLYKGKLDRMEPVLAKSEQALATARERFEKAKLALVSA